MVQITVNGQYKNLYLTPNAKNGVVSPGMKHDETVTLTLRKVWETKSGVSAPNKGAKPWVMHPFQVELNGEEASFAVFESDPENLAFMKTLSEGDSFTVHMTKENYIDKKGVEKIASKLTFKKVE